VCIKISLIKTQYSMENFQNEFQTIEYNADKSLVTQIWKKNSEKLERESFEKSVEQTLAEDKGQEMPHKFFQNEDEAREWLFE